MIVKLGAYSFDGRFDTHAPVSKLPVHLIGRYIPPALVMGGIPISVLDGDLSFSTVLKMESGYVSDIVLGCDWYAMYKEHLIASNHVTVPVGGSIEGDLAFQPLEDDRQTAWYTVRVFIDELLALQSLNDEDLDRVVTSHGLISRDDVQESRELVANHIMNGHCAYRCLKRSNVQGLIRPFHVRSHVVSEVLKHAEMTSDDLQLYCKCLAIDRGRSSRTARFNVLRGLLLDWQRIDEVLVPWTDLLTNCKIKRRDLLRLSAAHGLASAGPDDRVPVSFFDPLTGELTLRCLDGLVNNFNTTILQTMRNNMDIKFIGSGPAAKAILYYITNYISKAQLNIHIAYDALERAVYHLGQYDPMEDELTVRAKRLLQRCAYTMISHQELSSQQVCHSLLGYEEKFASHEFRWLFWVQFEKYIDGLRLSPECCANTVRPISPPEMDNRQSDDKEPGDGENLSNTAVED
ncbi:hypothetical protein C0992_000491 [Termitomyces sp. T32_za158]|nr:hypothetical protein C0992_000491 [Termitomyces sp. T32_za158]